jgi:hypothetical protein
MPYGGDPRKVGAAGQGWTGDATRARPACYDTLDVARVVGRDILCVRRSRYPFLGFLMVHSMEDRRQHVRT